MIRGDDPKSLIFSRDREAVAKDRKYLNNFLNELEKETEEFDILSKLANAPGLLYGMDKLINRDKIEALMEDKIKEQMDPSIENNYSYSQTNQNTSTNTYTNVFPNSNANEYQNEPINIQNPSFGVAKFIDDNFEPREQREPDDYKSQHHPTPYQSATEVIRSGQSPSPYNRPPLPPQSRFRRTNYDEYKRLKKKKKRRQMQILNEKITLLTYLDRLKRKGIIVRPLDANSNFQDIKLEALKHRQRRKIEFGKHIFTQILLDIIKIIELITTKIEIVDLHLTGWHRNVQYHLNEYDDIIEDIVDKYTSTDEGDGPSMPPEAKLGLLLLVSAVEHAASNSSVGSSVGSIKQLFTSSSNDFTPPQPNSNFEKAKPSNFEDDEYDEALLAEIEKERQNL